MLVGNIAGCHETALKLIHPLLQYGEYYIPILHQNDCMLYWALNFCFRLLEESAPGEDHVRDNSVASLIRILHHYYSRLKGVKYTPTQFDMLVDYHLHICEGTDHDTISNTFIVLMSLGGPPSTHDRMGRYIDTMICFMGHENRWMAPLRAAWVLRSAVASMGQDNESLRERLIKTTCFNDFVVCVYTAQL